MGCPAKQEATRVCWREMETGARSKGSGRPLSERTLVRPVCHRRLSQPKGSDLHNVESRPLRLRTLVRVQLSPLPPVIGRAFFLPFFFLAYLPQKPASGEKSTKPLCSNVLQLTGASHEPTARQCRSSEQFSHATGSLHHSRSSYPGSDSCKPPPNP